MRTAGNRIRYCFARKGLSTGVSVDEALIDTLARAWLEYARAERPEDPDDPSFPWDTFVGPGWDQALWEMDRRTNVGLAVLLRLTELSDSDDDRGSFQHWVAEYFAEISYPVPAEAWDAFKGTSWVQDMIVGQMGWRIARSEFPRQLGQMLVEELRAAYPGTGTSVWPEQGEIAEWDAEVAEQRRLHGSPVMNPTGSPDVADPLAALGSHSDGDIPASEVRTLRSLYLAVPSERHGELFQLFKDDAVILVLTLDGMDDVIQGHRRWPFGFALVDEVERLVARPGLSVRHRRSN